MTSKSGTLCLRWSYNLAVSTLYISLHPMELSTTPTQVDRCQSVSSEHILRYRYTLCNIYTGTRVIKVEVKVLKEEVVVRCVFRHTLSERCYIQLVSSELKEKFHKGECVVGKEQASHSFPDLLLAIYTVLVYGLAAGEELCSPGGPDYITLVTVHHPHPTPITLHPIFNPTYNSSSVLNSVSTTDRTSMLTFLC